MSEGVLLKLDGGGASFRSRGKKAQRLSLMEQSYRRIRADILTCRLVPGSEISEAELAERLKMSKTPVREALGRLGVEGFVRAIPRRGYQITPLTIYDMTELFELRGITEAGVVPLAIDRITAEQFDELEALAIASYNKDALNTLDRFIQANREFHLAIAKATGNSRLVAITERELDELQRFFYIGAQSRDVSIEDSSDHMRIVTMLRNRDVEGARNAIIAHQERTRQGIFYTLANTRDPSFMLIA